jgi:hypothetical protein
MGREGLSEERTTGVLGETEAGYAGSKSGKSALRAAAGHVVCAELRSGR